jgi:predicted glutamine amidotransferase
MCRLLGVVSSRRATVSELLADDLGPFVNLACEHPDGWGIGHVGPTDRVLMTKEAGRADRSSRFSSLVNWTMTDAALLHLRLASNDLAVTAANTHPFGNDGEAFAHNGYFAPTGAIDKDLGADLVASAGGDTDSERYYLAVRSRIEGGLSPAKALADAAARIRAAATEWVSLNCLYLTPQAMFAYADHHPDSEVIRRRGPGFFDLGYRVEPGKVVIASSGWSPPGGGWIPLPERHVLEVRRHDLRTTIHES